MLQVENPDLVHPAICVLLGQEDSQGPPRNVTFVTFFF